MENTGFLKKNNPSQPPDLCVRQHCTWCKNVRGTVLCAVQHAIMMEISKHVLAKIMIQWCKKRCHIIIQIMLPRRTPWQLCQMRSGRVNYTMCHEKAQLTGVCFCSSGAELTILVTLHQVNMCMPTITFASARHLMQSHWRTGEIHAHQTGLRQTRWW